MRSNLFDEVPMLLLYYVIRICNCYPYNNKQLVTHPAHLLSIVRLFNGFRHWVWMPINVNRQMTRRQIQKHLYDSNGFPRGGKNTIFFFFL